MGTADKALLRVCIYARYSSDLQSSTSCDDQIRRAREFATRQVHPPWIPLDEWVLRDDAVSGGSAVIRVGFQRIVTALESPRPPFDVVIVDDWKRLSREADVGLRILKLCFARRVHLIGLDGFDSTRQSAKLEAMTRGLIAEMERDGIATATWRGQEGAFLRSFATGGLPYGYRSRATKNDPRRGESECVIEIDPEQAAVVRGIFEMYASGIGRRQIADTLNSKGVPSPRAVKIRNLHRNRIPNGYGWQRTSLGHMLRNEMYIGKLIWNRRDFFRDPMTGKRVCVNRAREEWINREAPELRVIPQELWSRVQARLQEVRAKYTAHKTVKDPIYLLSNLASCICHGPIRVVGKKSVAGRLVAVYGCGRRAAQGKVVCSNTLSIPVILADHQLLEALGRILDDPSAMEYAVRRFTERLRAMHSRSGKGEQLEYIARELAEVEKATCNLVRAIESGEHFSGPLQKRLAELSDRQAFLEARKAEICSRPKVLPANFSIDQVRKAVLPLHELFDTDRKRGRLILEKFISGMVWEPMTDEEGRFYRVKGTTNLSQVVQGTLLGPVGGGKSGGSPSAPPTPDASSTAEGSAAPLSSAVASTTASITPPLCATRGAGICMEGRSPTSLGLHGASGRRS